MRCDAEWGYHTDMSVHMKVPRGGIAPFWGSAISTEKASRDIFSKMALQKCNVNFSARVLG